MKVESRIFEIVTAFFFLCAIVYSVLAHEPVGMAALFLDRPMPPARALVEAGAAVALATDFNPGSAYCESLPLVCSLAATQLGMSPEQALTACTVNAAHVLGRADRIGRLAPGFAADCVLLDDMDRAAARPRGLEGDGEPEPRNLVALVARQPVEAPEDLAAPPVRPAPARAPVRVKVSASAADRKPCPSSRRRGATRTWGRSGSAADAPPPTCNRADPCRHGNAGNACRAETVVP